MYPDMCVNKAIQCLCIAVSSLRSQSGSEVCGMLVAITGCMIVYWACVPQVVFSISATAPDFVSEKHIHSILSNSIVNCCYREELSDSQAEATSLQDQLHAYQQEYTQTTSSFEQESAAAALQHKQETQQKLQQQQEQHKAALQAVQQQHQADLNAWHARHHGLESTRAELQARLETALQEGDASQSALRQLQQQV